MNVLIEFTKWLLKWLGIILLGGVVLVSIIGGSVWAWQWWSHDRHAANIKIIVKHKDQWSGDMATTSFRLKPNKKPLCSEDTHPVFIAIVNNSSKTIEFISIKISAYIPNHSTNILRYDSYASSDRIVGPKEEFGQCWNFQLDTEYKNDIRANNAVYKGALYSVRFKD